MYVITMPDAEDNILQQPHPHPRFLYSFFPPPVGDGIDVKVTYSEHFEQ